ncbi:MAG TPA: hypothetical protein VHQ01_10915 [Pyrinomonadaceae bacterium]|nr:hypothetical protein [Pyrinomonadaceae bacterium]
MDVNDLQRLWSETLRSAAPDTDMFDRLAQGVVDLYASGNLPFRQHIKNRFKRVADNTGQELDAANFNLAMARAFIADEIGFSSWDKLLDSVQDPSARKYPILFQYATAALWRGDFTSLERAVGEAKAFDATIKAWLEAGYFANEPETSAEAFAAACWLGRDQAAAVLLDAGVDPYAGMRTGLSGFHWAASSARLNVIKLLIERKVPMEVENMYGGTVFGQAIWSAVNEWTPYHAEIVEELVKAGAVIEEGYRKWWDEQDVPDAVTKRQIAEILRHSEEFHERLDAAKRKVEEAEADGGERIIADSLKALGNLLRRPPFLRDAANEAYGRAAALYHDLGLPLEEAWVKRHIGINHEYAGRLEEAEKYYDEALALYREHSREDDLNYANGVRYPAVIKERLGKKDESAKLWEEAHDRYARVHPNSLGEGVAEAAAWLTILAIEKGDLPLARQWFEKANTASQASSDPDTHKFIAEVRAKLESR